ncbi:MAG: zinc ribbon domain-containing protein [Myxococcales bacterium]|jgi:putative FmdB family regulatory protein
MPLFDYVCQACSHPFEALVAHASDETECPSCGSRKLEKQPSMFAVGTARGGRDEMPAACRSCGDGRGPGACGMA